MNSTDEIVNSLDESFKVIGYVTKKQAHETGLLHPIIIAEVINSQNEWLLVEQASDRQDAGQLVSPVGGHIRSGETEMAALAREAKEELGISLPASVKNHGSVRRIGQAVFDRKIRGRHENHLFILYEIYTEQKPVLNHESVSFKYLPFISIASELAKNRSRFGAAFHFVWENFYN